MGLSPGWDIDLLSGPWVPSRRLGFSIPYFKRSKPANLNTVSFYQFLPHRRKECINDFMGSIVPGRNRLGTLGKEVLQMIRSCLSQDLDSEAGNHGRLLIGKHIWLFDKTGHLLGG